MPSSKKPKQTPAAKKNKFPIFTIVGIIFLIVLAFLIYRIMEPAPVTAPAKLPPPTASQAVNGIYKGNLPCADCPGITETLILANDNSYILEDVYQEKSTKPFQTSGKWEIINSNVLKLTPNDNSQTSYFQITDSGDLQMLDSNMQKIDSPFNQTLQKQH